MSPQIEAIAMLNAKFNSLNGVPIDSCRISRSEYAQLVQALASLDEAVERDAARYRWLNRRHNFMIYIEDNEGLRDNVRLRCGLPLDEWIDNRLAEEKASQSAPEGKE